MRLLLGARNRVIRIGSGVKQLILVVIDVATSNDAAATRRRPLITASSVDPSHSPATQTRASQAKQSQTSIGEQRSLCRGMLATVNCCIAPSGA